MSAAIRAWRRYWFAPGQPEDLAIPRLLVCGFLLWRNFETQDLLIAHPLFDELWRPVSFFSWLAAWVPGPETFAWMAGAWKLALAFGCLGLFSRTSLTASFVLGLLVIGWGQNFGKVMHSHHVALVITGVLALSRCGDAWSLDAWWRRRRGAVPAGPSGEYTWPVRCAWLVLLLMFFSAGVSKLRHGGLDWIFSDSFSTLLVLKQYEKVAIGPWGLQLAQFGWLCQLLALFTVVVELAAPLAMLGRRLRAVLAVSLFCMQAGIAIFMGVHPESPNFACYAFFVPWSRLLPGRRAAT